MVSTLKVIMAAYKALKRETTELHASIAPTIKQVCALLYFHRIIDGFRPSAISSKPFRMSTVCTRKCSPSTAKRSVVLVNIAI
jgi:hypothetical protein